MGHRIHPRARIGFSIIWIDEFLIMREYSRIGNFNIIRIIGLSIDDGAYIGRLNRFNGPFEIILEKTAAIGNGNSCYRAPIGVTYGSSIIKLGILTKITSNHSIDCTRSVIMGDYSIIAGHSSQLWTHAYYHDFSGPGRFRLDGSIEIGSNVYIGSGSILNLGIRIADGVVVGANSSVSKSLLKAGAYVSQPLRYIENRGNQRERFKKVEEFSICEEVFERVN
ncbi:MAG: hypothetical protein EBR30_08110 [Cytophagia bacterium]|nr:hypothetical protein [Cytophagia bacterium]